MPQSSCADLELAHQAGREEAREAVVALAVLHTSDVPCYIPKIGFANTSRTPRDELNDRGLEEIHSPPDQLRMLGSQGDERTAERRLARSVEIAKLQQANTDFDRLRADLEGHRGNPGKDHVLPSSGLYAMRSVA